MKKIILTLISILSMNAFAEIEFICWENGVWQGCSERVNVDISGFDSTLTVPLNQIGIIPMKTMANIQLTFGMMKFGKITDKSTQVSLLKIITILQLQVIVA